MLIRQIPGFEDLSEKQQAFLEAYLSQPALERSPPDAAESVGLSRGYGAATLRKPTVKAVVNAYMAEVVSKEKIPRDVVSAEAVLNELAAIGFSRITDSFHWSEEHVGFVPSLELTDAQAAAIQSIKARTITILPQEGQRSLPRRETFLEVKLYPKIPALQMIATYLGMLVERHEVKGSIEHKVQEMSDEELIQRAQQLISVLPEVKSHLLPPGKGNGKVAAGNGRPR
jgi:hypothetical protein